MIDAWDIYWVLQLDTIGFAAALLTLVGGAVVALAWIGFLDSDTRLSLFVPAMLTLLWLPVLALAVFLPSTKTAAAMFVIPAIANNETIQRESGELYDLAKQALAEAVKPDKSKPAD